MIKGIEPTQMAPWIFGRMETVFRWRVCADCSNERERTVEVSVPGDGSNREDGDRGKGGCRRKRRCFLQCRRLAISGSPKKKRENRGLTLGADDGDDDDDANLLWNKQFQLKGLGTTTANDDTQEQSAGVHTQAECVH